MIVLEVVGNLTVLWHPRVLRVVEVLRVLRILKVLLVFTGSNISEGSGDF